MPGDSDRDGSSPTVSGARNGDGDGISEIPPRPVPIVLRGLHELLDGVSEYMRLNSDALR